jgi:hypothetical protein
MNNPVVRIVRRSLLPLALLLALPSPAYLPLPAYGAADAAAAGALRQQINPLVARQITGTVYEDINGDASVSGDPGAANVAVRLYRDTNDDGRVNAGDTFLSATTTDGSGGYNFGIDTDLTGAHYLIAVDSRSVRPATPLNGGYAPDDIWAQQTFGDDPATSALDVAARYGGVVAAVSDLFDPVSTNPDRNRYQHLARTDVGGGDAAGVHFGFSFNVVTNTRAGDAADDAGGEGRTVQGSLRQFLQNGNALAGANAMRFVPAVPTNAAGGGGQWWRIAVSSDLPAILDPGTALDGTAYFATDGVTERDDNPGSLGSGGSVGTDLRALPTVGRPELEIVGTANQTLGLDLQADNASVRRLAIYGFGDRVNRVTDANIRIDGQTGTVIEECVIGASAASFTAPGAGRTGDNIRLGRGSGGSILGNLIGFADGNGIGTWREADGWRIEGNEIAGNARADAGRNGISLVRCTRTIVVGNLIRENGGAGIDTRNCTGANILTSNTIWRNGIGVSGQVVSPGVRLFGADNVIDRNLVYENYGAGLMVTSGAGRNTITRNSIHANGTIVNNGGSPPTGQIGIDLLDGSEDNRTGDPPYYSLNDPGDADSGANGLVNFPVLEAAIGAGVNLNLTGWARPAAVLELFIAAPDPSGFGEGQVYLLTLTEGSIDDLDTTTGSYGPGPVNGIAQGQDSTNRFRFVIAVPAGVTDGSLLTATATSGGATSEFSGTVPVVLNAPDITLIKSSLTDSDPVNALVNPKAIPGAVILNTIMAINTGNGATDNDAVVITDPLPPQTALFVGDLGGPGSGPILYEEGPTPGGLTYTFGGLGDVTDDVEFSNDGGIGYSYIPTPDADGFDTAVTHVRVTPGGAFAASDGVNHPNFSVRFKSRLQ